MSKTASRENMASEELRQLAREKLIEAMDIEPGPRRQQILAESEALLHLAKIKGWLSAGDLRKPR